jgi:hypothetical protein
LKKTINLKQVSSNPIPKENTRLNSHSQDLLENPKSMNLVIYLQMIGNNVDHVPEVKFEIGPLDFHGSRFLYKNPEKNRVGEGENRRNEPKRAQIRF